MIYYVTWIMGERAIFYWFLSRTLSGTYSEAGYLAAALIVRRYYTLTTPFLKRIICDLDMEAGNILGDNANGQLNDGRSNTTSAPGAS